MLNALSFNFQNVKAVEKKTVAFAGIAAGGRGGFRIEAAPSDEVDASLYGGGRRGQRRDCDDYAAAGAGGGGGDSDDDDGGRASAAAEAARERNKRTAMLRKELELRKGGGGGGGGKLSQRERDRQEKERRREEEESLKSSRVRAARFTGTKITGLEVQARESYLSLLQGRLRRSSSLDLGVILSNLSNFAAEFCTIWPKHDQFKTRKT